MKIVSTFVKGLYAFRYDGQWLDELERLFEEWSDIEWLEAFFEQNESDLPYFKIEIDGAINDTISESIKLRKLLLEVSKGKSSTLDEVFKPLDNLEYRVITLSKQKASRRWLRLYAIRVEANYYVITGGAIKLTHKMQDREHTKKELNKLEKCRSFLQLNDVFDADSFNEFTL